MKTISGSENLILTYRINARGVTVLRAATNQSVLILPETVEDLPVIAVGDHAFTPGRRQTEGEQLCFTCGPVGQKPMDNAQLEEVVLPATVETLGDYAFYNCSQLKKLQMHDTVRVWGGALFMNCRLLDTLELWLTEDGRACALSHFADELSRELDVTLHTADGGLARLIFPEYIEVLEENCPAHHFDYNIHGAGYPYHHCFRSHAFSLPEFDPLWEGFLHTEHEASCALRLAWWRLRTPLDLSEDAEAAYRAYLGQHSGEMLLWLLQQRDFQGLSWFLSWCRPERDALEAASARARQLGATEGQALLLEALHRCAPSGGDALFDL